MRRIEMKTFNNLIGQYEFESCSQNEYQQTPQKIRRFL